MASGRPGALVFDPTQDAEAGETPNAPGGRNPTPDLSGGGLIAGPGTYYSRGTAMAESGWSDVSDQLAFTGGLVGTLTPEFSNASDDEMRTGEDQWDDYTSEALPDPDVTIPGIGSDARTIDVDTLDFAPVASGSDLTARVATVAALPAVNASGTGVGKTLTRTGVGVLTIDGVATVLNDLILVKNQASAIDNGLYTVTTEGTAIAAAVLTRATTMDQTGAETTPGVTVAITAGTVNTGLSFVLTGDAQEFGIALNRFPYGRVRYRLVVTSGSGTVKSRRVIKAS